MDTRTAIVVLALGSAVLLGGCNAGTGQRILSAWTDENGLSEQTIVNGLKEALTIGTQRAVDQVSATGGYNANPLIRIDTPEDLDRLQNALRKIGLGSQVDRFETEMNKAAEMAAAEAVPIFVGAIRSMSFQDAREILQGSDTAATEYFRANTASALLDRYKPIIDTHMERLGVVRLYNDLLARYHRIPLVPPLDVDVQSYVADRAVDGLFTVLANEERRIRENPAARTSELLRRVFAR